MDVLNKIASYGVVPVIVIEDAKDALPLADALIDGGLPIAEITLRTPAALDAIKLIATHRPEMHLGAGTVIFEDQIAASQGAGARFALAPGFDAMVVGEAKKGRLPFVPGVMTTSDIQAALQAGCRKVKFFPAEASGGVTMLRSLSEPYRHTGLEFNPTGGVTIDTMNDWLEHPSVFAVGGSWIARADDITAGNWDRISKNAKTAREMAEAIRKRVKE